MDKRQSKKTENAFCPEIEEKIIAYLKEKKGKGLPPFHSFSDIINNNFKGNKEREIFHHLMKCTACQQKLEKETLESFLRTYALTLTHFLSILGGLESNLCSPDRPWFLQNNLSFKNIVMELENNLFKVEKRLHMLSCIPTDKPASQQ